MKASELTREHFGREVVVRMGKDRSSGILTAVAHWPDSVTVHISGESGRHICCVDTGSEVEVL